MEEKRRYLPEVLLTLVIIEALFFLLGEALSDHRIYFNLALIGGFSFAWLNRKHKISLTRVTVNIAILAVFAWIIYSLLNSSFLYREIIVIFIKALLAVEIIFSFDGFSRASLNYIQALSLPLFLCFPIFVKDYNLFYVALVFLYVVCWLLIFKLKFYAFLNAQRKKMSSHGPQVIVSAASFLAILFITWALFYRVSLPGTEKGGLFQEESGGLQEGREKKDLEKEYYALQDNIQEELLDLLPGLTFQEDRQEMLMLVSLLIKDSLYIAEVREAYEGLISRLNTPGPGIEKGKGEELTASVKKYMDSKIPFNIDSIAEKMLAQLKNDKPGLFDMLSVSELISKLQNADTSEKVKKYSRELRRAIDSSSAGEGTKRELRELAGHMRDWKNLELYRDKTASLEEDSGPMDDRAKSEIRELLSDINNASDARDLKDAENKAGDFKEELPGKDKDAAGRMEEILDLKSEVLLSDKAAGSKGEIEKQNLSDDSAGELKEELDGIRDARNEGEFSESVSEYQQKARESRVEDSDKTEGLLEIKGHLLFNGKKEEVREELKKGNLPDKGREFMEELEALEEAGSAGKLNIDTEELKNNIEDLSAKGLISKNSEKRLMEDMEEIKDILMSMLKAAKGRQDMEDEKNSREADYLSELKESIERSKLEESEKESLRQLAQALDKAQSISQLENIREAAEKQIEDLSKDKNRREDAEKIRKDFDPSFETKRIFIVEGSLSSLREKADQLQQVSPKAAEKIRNELEKIRESESDEELRQRLETLKERINPEKDDFEEKIGEAKGAGGLDIYILPANPVIPAGSSISLAGIAVYNKTVIKKIGADAEWFSSDPHVAWVDESGGVHAISKGNTRVYLRYSGGYSQKIDVTVVEGMDEQISKAIEREAVR